MRFRDFFAERFSSTDNNDFVENLAYPPVWWATQANFASAQIKHDSQVT